MRELRFSSMGTWCHVLVHGGAADAAEAVRVDVERLARDWTRFSPDSEVSRVNARPGRWMRVSTDTRRLAQRALWGWRTFGGSFDPFLADRMIDIGYDRDFDEVVARADRPAEDAENPTGFVPAQLLAARFHGRRPIDIDVAGDRLRVRLGATLDSGGIGKGFAADLTAQAALRRGAAGVLVNLGGDLRCAGATPADGWQVSLDDAWRPGEPSGWSVKLQAGAVATSSALRRRWTLADGRQVHHLLDPRTGLSLEPRYAAVSVIAPQAWLAEVLTKVVFLTAEDRLPALLRKHQAAAVVTGEDGARRQLG